MEACGQTQYRYNVRQAFSRFNLFQQLVHCATPNITSCVFSPCFLNIFRKQFPAALYTSEADNMNQFFLQRIRQRFNTVQNFLKCLLTRHSTLFFLRAFKDDPHCRHYQVSIRMAIEQASSPRFYSFIL